MVVEFVATEKRASERPTFCRVSRAFREQPRVAGSRATSPWSPLTRVPLSIQIRRSSAATQAQTGGLHPDTVASRPSMSNARMQVTVAQPLLAGADGARGLRA